MLYGRSAQCDILERLLADARRSRSGALVVRGEAGAGKTALLEHAAGRANGMLVLRANGVESEAELLFAALHQLLRPVLGLAGRLPEPQATPSGAPSAWRRPMAGAQAQPPGGQGPVPGLGGRPQPPRRGGRGPGGAVPGRRGPVAGPLLGRGAGVCRPAATRWPCWSCRCRWPPSSSPGRSRWTTCCLSPPGWSGASATGSGGWPARPGRCWWWPRPRPPAMRRWCCGPATGSEPGPARSRRRRRPGWSGPPAAGSPSGTRWSARRPT
jgi:hypothetical protein